MVATSLKGLNHRKSSFESSRKGCEWPGRGGPWIDGTIIEVGFAWVLWNQDLSNERGKLARKKIGYMRGEKIFRGRGRRRVRMNK